MESEALAHTVIAKLRGAGHQAYLVGGCVRDLLLGVKPKDFDVSTDARPDRIMDLFPKSGRVGALFGVVLVRDVFDQVEVATFRSDHEYEDGRHPESVRFESDPAPGCIAARLHHQRPDDGSRDRGSPGFRGRPGGLEAGHSASHRRPRFAFSRRPSTAAARGAVCGAAGF